MDHVVVVDNASTDGTSEWLQSLDDSRLHLITKAENTGGARGFASALKAAADTTDAQWFVLMDDDAWPKPGTIAEFRRLDLSEPTVHAASV